MHNSSRSQSYQKLDQEIARLRRLVADLTDIRNGNHPDPKILNASPCLEAWKIAQRPAPCLTGFFFGHPEIGDGEFGVTSEVWFVDGDRQYIRTRSRFYTLGNPGTR